MCSGDPKNQFAIIIGDFCQCFNLRAPTHQKGKKVVFNDRVEAQLVEAETQRRLCLFESRLAQLETENVALRQKLNLLGN